MGVEALLRWEHPEHGSVSPAVFIPVAEQSDLILRLGAWVLDEACAQAAGWSERLGASLRMSVNLSARQIVTAATVDLVSGALERSGFDPGQLALEITETVLMEETDAPLATLDALKALGVEVVLDDFGTGYSSLSYLKRFPIETLKIDQAFVSNMLASDEDAAIVTACSPWRGDGRRGGGGGCGDCRADPLAARERLPGRTGLRAAPAHAGRGDRGAAQPRRRPPARPPCRDLSSAGIARRVIGCPREPVS